MEVLDVSSTEVVSRFTAKQNLHLIGEITQKLRSYSDLFDKYWYRKREFQYTEAISLVQQQQFFTQIQKSENDTHPWNVKKDQINSGAISPLRDTSIISQVN